MIPAPKLSEVKFQIELFLHFIQNPFGQLDDINCFQNNF